MLLTQEILLEIFLNLKNWYWNLFIVIFLAIYPKELKILTNYEYLEQNDWKQKDKKDTPFDLLNTSLCDSGISYIIEPDTDINKPIHILFICSGNENLIISPQVNIDISRSSSATVIEQYVNWLSRALRGDFGKSYHYKAPVVEMISGRILGPEFYQKWHFLRAGATS